MTPTNLVNGSWDNDRHWPACYRSQAEARLPAGELHAPQESVTATRWQWFCFGLLFGLLILGPAVADAVAGALL